MIWLIDIQENGTIVVSWGRYSLADPLQVGSLPQH
jgi:hypothetical protein